MSGSYEPIAAKWVKMANSKFKLNYIPEIKAIIIGRPKPGMVSVNLTNKCNLNCIYCEIGKDNLPTDNNLINKEDMIWIIDQMAVEGIKSLSMCGGEPFIFQGLTDIVHYAWEKNIRSNITSNGMIINKLSEYGTKGLYEARISLASNIWRVFCFFDKGRLVILLNGFTKKTQKTPKREIEKALRLMNDYFNEKMEESK